MLFVLCGAATTANSSFHFVIFTVLVMVATPKMEDVSNKIKIAVGRLLKDADPISKKVLTIFDPSKDSEVNISKLAKVNRAELDALATYLKLPLLTSESKKKLYSSRDKLAKRIVLEIRSLYPSVCLECTKEYTVMPGNQPQYRCWICLQGAHDCEQFTAMMEAYLSQPAQINGMVWLCHDCLSLNNPFPGSDEANPSAVGTPIPLEKVAESQEQTTSSEILNNDINNKLEVVQKEQEASQKQMTSSEILNSDLNNKLEVVQKEQEASESKPNTCTHVCPRLIDGTCPHGISGKNEAEGKEKCELFHPKRCPKYLRFYTHETRGCREGDNCAYLHVNICKSSIETKKCKDIACTAMHLVGTKRPKSMRKKRDKIAPSKKIPSNPPEIARDKKGAKPQHLRKEANTSRQSQGQKKKETPEKESFLGMKSLLDEMKSTVLGEIKSLYKQQLETLKTTTSAHSAHNQAATHYGHYKPTPYGVSQCQHLCQQRMEKYPCQPTFYPPGITPIPPACC